MVDHLRDTGELDNTLVVFTADHGDFAGEHGLVLKNLGIYESVHRIPLVLAGPGIPTGHETDELVESVDLAPTLIEAAGARPLTRWDGSSLATVARGGSGKDAVVAEWEFSCYTSRVVSARTKAHRLTWYGPHEPGELFDHRKDPDELENVWSQDEYRQIRLDLTERIVAHLVGFPVNSDIETDRVVNKASLHAPARLLHKSGKRWSEMSR